MKKLIILLCILTSSYRVFTQNDTIGEFLIYHDSTEYYLLFESDTFWINHKNITVRFNDTVSSAGRESFNEMYTLTYVRETSGSFFNYNLSPGSDFVEVCDSIYHDTRIEKINFGFKLQFHGFEPDDDQLHIQWYLDKINVFEAWDLTTRNEDIAVAVIDEGLFLEHDDIGYDDYLLENIFHNITEDEWDDSESGDGEDGDEEHIPPIQNGKIDDWKGWNYYNYIAEPNPHHIEDNNVIPEKEWGIHGTAISGIIAAKTNNSIDIAGIAGGNYLENKGGAKVLPIKISDWRWNSYENKWVMEFGSENIAPAIDYAVEMGANIINMSFGVNGPPSIMDAIEAAINHAYTEHNVLLVASAGNEGYNGFIPYPARDINVIAVGATDKDDERAYFQNGGASNCGDQMELAAPGVEIVSLDNDDHETYEGTSFSAPLVAATAALMLSVNPDLTNIQIRTILKNTAEKVGSLPYVNDWNCTHGCGRINTYAAVCEALEYMFPITINANTLWDSPVISIYDITVESGSVLTITSTLYMGPEARLIVEPGAEVNVDGGTITNFKLCGHANISWQGIEVWGNKNASQYTPGAQGKLTLDEAIIENAVKAVELFNPDDNNSTGGIIEATDAIFLNNARAIHAKDYKNLHPVTQNEMDYFGTFNNCSFIINTDYIGYKTFYKHVDLDRVKGIKFYGCTFTLDHSATNISQWTLGIAAYNAGFNVLPVCTNYTIPCTEYDSCRFAGFDRGIGAVSSTLIDYPILIRNARFDDNTTGIFISGMDYAAVINNFLEVGFNAPYIGNCGFANGVGIDIQASIGFGVENNKLRKNNQADSGIYAGIRVVSCPSEHDIIYKNELIGLSYGNYAEGTNRDLDNDSHGVEYQCNYNSHNVVDFIVTHTDPDLAKIRGWQGSRDTASGNVFTRYTPPVWHFRNEGTSTINYYYCAPCTDEEPTRIYALRPEYFEKIESPEFNCPDHYGGNGHILLTGGEENEKETIFIQNMNNYNSVNYLYESLADGGDPETELSDIQMAEPDDMWNLRSQLLDHSPHLSQEVLRAVSDRTDVFPDDVLLEILASNPDELNRDTLLSYLEQKENPLPDYMISILQQAIEGVTYKTILQENLAKYHASKTQSAQDIIRDILYDSAFDNYNYRSWLGNLNSFITDRLIISSYLSDNDTASAIELLNLLPSLYGIEGEGLMDYNDYKTLVEMQISWMSQQKNPEDLDRLEVADLIEIASDNISYAGYLARNILDYANLQHYCNCITASDSAILKNFHHSTFVPESEEQLLKIYTEPNPAHTYVSFNYELLGEKSTGIVVISDITGNIIHRFSVAGRIGQEVWNTSGVNAGVYYYRLISCGLSKSGRIIIY